MEENTPRYIHESDTPSQQEEARFISVDTPQIRVDENDSGHAPKNRLKLWLCLLLLIPVLVLSVFYFVIDNPKASSDQRPSLVYSGETDEDKIQFDFAGVLPASYYNGGDIYLEFYEASHSSTPSEQYGYVPSVVINRAADDLKESSYFIVNINDVKCHQATQLGDAVYNEEVKRPLERGRHYILKLKGSRRGVIFTRPEKDRFCSFVLEEKKKDEISPMVSRPSDKNSSANTISTATNNPNTQIVSSGNSSNRNNNVNVSGTGNAVVNGSGNTSITVIGSGNIVGNSNSSSNSTSVKTERIIYSEGGLYGVKDGNGEVIVAPQYANILSYQGEYAKVQSTSNRYGMIDRQGNEICSPVYNEIYHFSSGMAKVLKNGRYGYINQQGQLTVRTIYNEAYDFYGNYALVQKGSALGFVGKDGTEKGFVYERVMDNTPGRVWLLRKMGKWGLVTKDGRELTEFIYDNCLGYMDEGDGYFMFKMQKQGQIVELYEHSLL